MAEISYEQYMTMIRDALVKSLDNNVNPWRQPFSQVHNPVTGTRFGGQNLLFLSALTSTIFNDDPRYMTFSNIKQWNEIRARQNERNVKLNKTNKLLVSDEEKRYKAGEISKEQFESFKREHPTDLPENLSTNLKLKAGSKCVYVRQGQTATYWLPKLDENGNKIFILDENGHKIPDGKDRYGNVRWKCEMEMVKCHSATSNYIPEFNGSMIENLEPFDARTYHVDFNKEYVFGGTVQCENGKETEYPGLIPNCPVPIRHDVYGQAYYSNSDDSIHLPAKINFEEESEYYSTLFHEMTHSTGTESRLNRDFMKFYHMDIKERAREELVAEISAYLICSKAGITYNNLDNSAAYIKSWAKELRNVDFADFYGHVSKAVSFLEYPEERTVLREKVMAEKEKQKQKSEMCF